VNEPLTGTYRSVLAHAMVAALDDSATLGQAVGIAY
jgi:hypothetical protein